MPIANITVAFVNPPKEGGKKGNVKTESGEYYGVWADKLPQYAKGGQYTVEYDVDTFNGKEYKTIKRIVAQSASASKSAPGRSDAEAVKIFVTGVIGRCYHGTGVIPEEDILYNQILSLRMAWEKAFAVSIKSEPQKSLTQELNDDIPF